MQLAAFFYAAIALPLAAMASVPQPMATTAAPCHADAKWTESAPPLHIHGDTWFVGTCGLSSILITSPQGDILIDGGVEEAAPLIEANIRELCFHVENVRYILNSHEHFDHAGGIAQLQRDSRAIVMVRAAAAATFARGRGDRRDPQFLTIHSFTPIANVRTIENGGKVRIGPLEITAHATPGHAPGGTTWTWKSCEKSRCLDVVYTDSVSAISDDVFRYTDEAAHPGYLAAFRRSIATIGALPCDLLITPHPDSRDLWSRLGAHDTAPLVDANACRLYAANAAAALDARLAREVALSKP